MDKEEKMKDTTCSAAALRATLKSQYHAALAMLRQSIDLCPDAIWAGDGHLTSSWQVAYHTLFFTHLYIQPNEQAFRAWEGQQSEVQYPDSIPGPPDPHSSLPVMPKPYTKAEVLAYWDFCDRMVDDAVDALDLNSPESGFSWYKVSKVEHQIINIRHIQHGAAQLADRLRSAAGVGIDWVGGAKQVIPAG